MKTGPHVRLLALALGLTPVAWPHAAAACAVCFGRSDAPMAHGLNMGILSLLLVVMSVLLGFAAFFVFLMVRSARASIPTATRPATAPTAPTAPGDSTADPAQKLPLPTQS